MEGGHTSLGKKEQELLFFEFSARDLKYMLSPCLMSEEELAVSL
jgi:hypothetical protein